MENMVEKKRMLKCTTPIWMNGAQQHSRNRRVCLVPDF